MKKAKLILASVAVFAVVGGALAFKANILQKVYVATTTDPAIAECTSTLFGYTFAQNNNATVQRLATTTTSQPCVLQTIYVTN